LTNSQDQVQTCQGEVSPKDVGMYL